VLLRKGGIREPTFTPKAQQFLLFPTAFHSEAQLLKPGIAERYRQVGLRFGLWRMICTVLQSVQPGTQRVG
jgi:hypothetical protein